MSDLSVDVLQRDPRAVARLLTAIENEPSSVRDILRRLFRQTGNSTILGITGSPGSGKSTLVDQVAGRLLEAGTKVGIVAVDPSSPFSGGAILGDRIRMSSVVTHPRSFIRSMATRGKMGGLSSAVSDALVVLDAAGYERLIVETVGVGQDEVDIARHADITLVVLVPGMGDDIQAIKAGIMEIADIFVVNKADHEGVDRTIGEVESLVSGIRSGDWTPPIVPTIASTGDGVEELFAAIADFEFFQAQSEKGGQRRILAERHRLLELLRDRVMEKVQARVSNREMEALATRIAARKADPYSEVERLLSRFGNKISKF